VMVLIHDRVDYEDLEGSVATLSGLGLRIPWHLRR
jgi:hypothetical protein